jgi:hypothetical protein
MLSYSEMNSCLRWSERSARDAVRFISTAKTSAIVVLFGVVQRFFRVVLADDVRCKLLFSSRAVALIASSAKGPLSVADNEDGLSSVTVLLKLKSGAFAWTRHRFRSAPDRVHDAEWA